MLRAAEHSGWERFPVHQNGPDGSTLAGHFQSNKRKGVAGMDRRCRSSNCLPGAKSARLEPFGRMHHRFRKTFQRCWSNDRIPSR